MRERKVTKVTEVKIEAVVGSKLNDCFREALELSVKEWRIVILIHNDHEYKIVPQNLLNSIEKNNK